MKLIPCPHLAGLPTPTLSSLAQPIRQAAPPIRAGSSTSCLPTILRLACFLLASGALGAGPLAAAASSVRPLPRSTPEAEGISSSTVLTFVEGLDQLEHVHSVMLLRHGRVIAEGWWAPYDAASRHELYSLSKSFTSTAVGFAVAEGLVRVDDEVLKFFPEDAPAEPSAPLKAMRVQDLLTMTVGHQDEVSSAADQLSAKSFLAQPVPHKPGTHFKYNTPATFMLSAIVQKRTGQTVLDYLRPRLFDPLGIEQPAWSTNFQGISLGGYGLRVRTEDIARFGQFYLQEGRWNGNQLLPASWIQAASSRQVSNGSNPKSDWDQGYGYQFWRCRNGAYRGDGAFGQYCVVFPEQDAVLAITSGLKDMQAVLNVVWDSLLPGFQRRRLPSHHARQKELATKLASLSLPTPAGSAQPGGAGVLLGQRYRFPTNNEGLDALTVQAAPSGQGWLLVQEIRGMEHRLPCGSREWQHSRGPWGGYPDEPLAASGAWTAEGTFVAQICARETPYIATLKLQFEGEQVTRELSMNVGFGGNQPTRMIGRSDPATDPR